MPKAKKKESAFPVEFAAERRSIPVDLIKPNPWNGHRSADDDLVASVKASGILQNIVVRTVPGTDRTGYYEIVSGSRRFDAAVKAGLTEVPCLVMELDDRQAREVTIIENLQREDLHPVDEATAIATLISDGHTKEEVAARIGKTVAFVQRRAKLAGLSPRVIESAGTDIRRMSVRALELLATLPPEKQIDIFDGWGGVTLDVEDLAREIENESGAIEGAPFDCADDTLYAVAGACANCPKRTGAEPLLFDDLAEIAKGDRCLDPECYRRKSEASLARLEAGLRVKHGDKLILAAEGMPYGEASADLRKRGVVDINSCRGGFERCKKKDAGSRPALLVHGRHAGDTVWVRETKAATAGETGEDGEEAKPASMAEKRVALDQRRHAWCATELTEKLRSDKLPAEKYRNDADMARIAAAFGGWAHEGDGVDFWKSNESSTPAVHERIWRAAEHALTRAMQVFKKSDIDEEFVDRCRVVADLVAVDYDDLFRQACEEIPEPKAWSKA